MKFLLIAISIFFSNIVHANEFNYRNTVGVYTVFGMPGNTENHPMCYMTTSFDDNSKFTVLFNVKNHELAVMFENTDWNITEEIGTKANLLLDFVFKNRIESLKFEFEVRGNNLIIIRHIIADKFIPLFIQGLKIGFRMPGNIPDSSFDLKDTYKAFIMLQQCAIFQTKNIGHNF